MKARMISIFQSCPRILVVLVAAAMLMFVACGPEDLGGIPDPAATSNTAVPKGKELDIWNGKPYLGTPSKKPPQGSHLSPCADTASCRGGTNCVDLFGEGALCFYKCDPKKGSGDTQNPNCIEPENCIALNNGTGICVALPGQLYGIGSYKAVVNHKQGKPCLLRYGGCETGLICVDTGGQGSIGTCEEFCDPNAKNTNCQTAGTSCKPLYSGVGACLK